VLTTFVFVSPLVVAVSILCGLVTAGVVLFVGITVSVLTTPLDSNETPCGNPNHSVTSCGMSSADESQDDGSE
jgi:hypothetical protein